MSTASFPAPSSSLQFGSGQPLKPGPSSMNPILPYAEEPCKVPRRSCVDFLVSILNLFFLTRFLGKLTNFTFANIRRDAVQFASHLAKGQYYKVYGRESSRHKYHPLQRFHNRVRSFDLVDSLAHQMDTHGNLYFYQALASNVSGAAIPFNYQVDLTRLDSITSLAASGDYLYNEISKKKGRELAQLARERYLRGFSRVINVADHADWQAFRKELINGKHVEAVKGPLAVEDAMLFAISYKGSTVNITRRMYKLNEDGSCDDEKGSMSQERIELTSDFLNDFRWSQIVRSCMTIAAEHGKSTVRIWLDRLVMLETPTEERKRIYKALDWEDFGMFPYMVCPVVRVYDRTEVEFGTDFWRKLETVMGVAGRGLIVDDYMLRQFDKSIYYGPTLYTAHQNGLSVIGGGGIYVRGVTLALATAVLTDAVTVAAANEDIRTVWSISGWKAWALETIGEGAYSAEHSFMMRQERPYDITMRSFQVIAFWESMVSQTHLLIGNSYLDMSVLKSSEYRKSSQWDGVMEWVGMMSESCQIQDAERRMINQFLGQNVKVKMYTTTTAHVSSMLLLTSPSGDYKRTLVVDMARYSTAINGQVTAVAEATGLWRGSVLPKGVKAYPDPDEDQEVKIEDEHGVVFTYKSMFITFIWVLYVACIVMLFALGLAVWAALRLSSGDETEGESGSNAISIIVLTLDSFLLIAALPPIYRALQRWARKWSWPWVDEDGVGEALFDNLLMHGLYDAGIKTYFRSLQVEKRYDEVGWF